MTGSVSESEELLENTWLRWEDVNVEKVHDPTRFLDVALIHRAMSHMETASSRRNELWLPEPIRTTAGDPTIEIALLYIYESLPPIERAVCVLHEAFQYTHTQIAQILDITIDSSRELHKQARELIELDLPERTTPEQHASQLAAFLSAGRTSYIAQLRSLFYDEVRSTVDCGDISVLIYGGHFWDGIEFTEAHVNGLPSLLLTRGGTLVALASVEATPEGINRIFWIVSPDKLSHLASPSGPRL